VLQEIQCPVCEGRNFSELLNLGLSPAANNLMDNKEQSVKAEKFKLGLVFCNKCGYARLSEIVDPEKLFINYTYLTGVSKETVTHFEEFSARIAKRLRSTNRRRFKIIDIGSNDGTLLKFFKIKNFEILGVEPSKNVSEIANKDGIPTINAFFTLDLATKIRNEFGLVDVITMTNVLTHVENPKEMLLNARSLLDNKGIIVAEFYYFPKLMENLAFDQIYHEHISYFTLRNFVEMLQSIGLDAFDAELTGAQGGSLRVWICKKGEKRIRPSVGKFLSNEGETDNIINNYYYFSRNVYKLRDEIVYFIKNQRAQGKTIAGYGASAKATTMINFCGLDSSSILFIADANPLKQEKYIPGTDIKVVSPNMINLLKPSIIIIFAWNLVREIISYFTDNLDYRPSVYVFIPNLREIQLRDKK